MIGRPRLLPALAESGSAREVGLDPARERRWRWRPTAEPALERSTGPDWGPSPLHRHRAHDEAERVQPAASSARPSRLDLQERIPADPGQVRAREAGDAPHDLVLDHLRGDVAGLREHPSGLLVGWACGVLIEDQRLDRDPRVGRHEPRIAALLLLGGELGRLDRVRPQVVLPPAPLE